MHAPAAAPTGAAPPGFRAEPRAWTAEWIWSDRPALAPPGPDNPFGRHDPGRFDHRVLFRTVFRVAGPVRGARLFITADSRYTAYLNGVEVGDGPVRHGPGTLYYSVHDLAGALVEGENVLAVAARFYGHPTPWWEPTPPTFTQGGGSLVAEVEVDGSVAAASGPHWRVREGDAWERCRPMGLLNSQIPEAFDARLLDPGWTGAGFDDTGWAPATVQAAHAVTGPRGRTRPGGHPYGVLLPHPLPPPAVTRHAPVGPPLWYALPPGADPDVHTALAADAAVLEDGTPARPDRPGGRALAVFDLGRIVSGRTRLTLDGPAGRTVTGALVEAVTPVALGSAAPFRIRTRNGRTRFTASDPSGGRYLVLSVDGPDVEVAVAVREALRPRPAGAGFECSDPFLEHLFAVALRTVDLTAQDAYLDCPTRESRAWVGDAVVHQAVDLATSPDWSLAVWNPRLLARARPDGMLPMVVAGDFARDGVPPIPDWALHWIRSVHLLYRYTGDREAVAELLGTAEGVLRWFARHARPDGLLHDVPGWVLIDWSPVQVAGCSAALNALWGRALADFAEMAAWSGDPGRALWARDAHARLAEGFEAFWDEERGAYRDTLGPAGPGRGVSEHTAAAAVCARLVPPRRRDRVRDLLLDRDAMFTRSPLADHGVDERGAYDGTPVHLREAPDWDTEARVVGAQPFFRYVVHDALAELGAADALVDLYRDWAVLLESGPSALRECWEGGSFAHGWSATPARDLVVHTLGVSPAEPGYASVRVAPRPGRLERIAGRVPTPHGFVEVAVENGRARVDSPVPVEFSHPSGRVDRFPAGERTITLHHAFPRGDQP
ncbi:alpha-L-rhamnosidase N-terminal domain-containing protein [Nocardiopsis sp. NPDC006139]|uniref:alpha-L-rhamnosidase-related protein n=1 Tax=Nocardiopsis sp. NPDC006139 TaxID=3154578 RepID=UPI0033A96319